jgi:hypothetical protein
MSAWATAANLVRDASVAWANLKLCGAWNPMIMAFVAQQPFVLDPKIMIMPMVREYKVLYKEYHWFPHHGPVLARDGIAKPRGMWHMSTGMGVILFTLVPGCCSLNLRCLYQRGSTCDAIFTPDGEIVDWEVDFGMYDEIRVGPLVVGKGLYVKTEEQRHP